LTASAIKHEKLSHELLSSLLKKRMFPRKIQESKLSRFQHLRCDFDFIRRPLTGYI